LSAPVSGHAESRRRLALIVEREYVPDAERCVRAILALLAPRAAKIDRTDDPADGDEQANGDRP
jgi:hypothetical protein